MKIPARSRPRNKKSGGLTTKAWIRSKRGQTAAKTRPGVQTKRSIDRRRSRGVARAGARKNRRCCSHRKPVREPNKSRRRKYAWPPNAALPSRCRIFISCFYHSLRPDPTPCPDTRYASSRLVNGHAGVEVGDGWRGWETGVRDGGERRGRDRWGRGGTDGTGSAVYERFTWCACLYPARKFNPLSPLRPTNSYRPRTGGGSRESRDIAASWAGVKYAARFGKRRCILGGCGPCIVCIVTISPAA